tara:strand:+ start:8409 stop:9530 length:1122 start_codon:yes stop_codon:yes gene_type:complete
LNRQFLLTSLLLLTSLGCNRLDTTYLSYRGESINGVRVFADILRDKGHIVDVWPSMRDQLYYGYDTIIILDKTNTHPSEELTAELLNHFEMGDAYEILYVGRDLDVTPHYWESIAQRLKETNQPEEAVKAMNEARQEMDSQMSRKSGDTDDENDPIIFTVKKNRTAIETLEQINLISFDEDAEESEDEQQSIEVDCDWRISRTMVPVEDAEVIWTDEEDEPLLVAVYHEYMTIYGMSSAYPLLNGALTNPSNRNVVDELDNLFVPDGKIALVTSGRLLNSENEDSQMWRFLKVFPHPWIVGQLFLFMIMFCLWKFPIFGRPRREEYQDLKRFGTHVEAFGDLLKLTRQRSFAIKKIREWKARQSMTQRHGVKN